jgi:putative membrane protein
MLTVASVLFFELFSVRHGMNSTAVNRIARFDIAFGASAGLLLVVGFLRVFLGTKPEAFYLENPVFWAKIAAFAAVAILSIAPTIRFIAWSRRARTNPGYAPPESEIRVARRFLASEAIIFVAIPVFAAAMARGYGI